MAETENQEDVTDFCLTIQDKSIEDATTIDQAEVPVGSYVSTCDSGTDLLIYSSVTATLSHQVISSIHGNKVEFLASIFKTENVTFSFMPENQIFYLTGSLNDIIKCQGCLRNYITGLKLGLQASDIYESLISNSRDAKDQSDEMAKAEHTVTAKLDKSVNCEILKAPIITKSGRIVKRTGAWVSDFMSTDSLLVEDLEDDIPELDDEVSVNEVKKANDSDNKSRRKRGRPRKTEIGKYEKENSAPDKLMIKNSDGNKPEKSKLNEADRVPNNTPFPAQEFVIGDDIKSFESSEILTNTKSSETFEVKIKEGNELGHKTSSFDKSDQNDTIVADSVKSEVGKAMKENLLINGNESQQNVYLNKVNETENDKVFKAKRSVKRSSDRKGDEDVKTDLKKLKQSYEKKMPYKYFCNKCSYKSKRESHFQKHKKIHVTNPDMPVYKCELCDFTTIRQSVLQKHKLCHSDNLLSCMSCKYRTNNPVHLSNHMKNRHSDSNLAKANCELFRCNVCPYMTKKSSLFTKHYLSHGVTFSASEDGKILTYKCNLCSYKTQRKEHLVRHKGDVHGNNRPYLCDLCGMSFKRVDALAAHKLTHMDRSLRFLPFKCTVCKKAFKSRAHLKEHLAVHTSLRAYLCDKCGASFKTKAVQKKHLQNIHINPGSFKCTTCPKAFNTKYALLRHIQHHEYASSYKPGTEIGKDPKKESHTDPFGSEQNEGQGQDLQVQEVQLQFHLQDYGGQVTLVPEEGQLIAKGEGHTIQITSSDGQDFEGQQVQGHDLEGQFLESEQVNDETIDENLTAIQTITLPPSQLRQFTQPIQTTEGEEIYIQNFTTDDGDSFVDPTRESVRQLYIPSNIDGQTSVIEVDGNTTFIQEIQGTESLIEEVKSLGGLEGIQTNQAILTINTDGTEKVFLANVENL